MTFKDRYNIFLHKYTNIDVLFIDFNEISFKYFVMSYVSTRKSIQNFQ